MSQPLYLQLCEQLGYLTWPLLICAFLALLIILERLALMANELLKRDAWLTELRKQTRSATPEQRQQLITQLSQGHTMLAKGTGLLLSHGDHPRAMREEILNLWLIKQKEKLQSGLKVLHIIGVITPLLGLLGTVLGLIEMFSQLGISDGPVTPSQLATGLGLAMNTTAAGLIIAVPAITMSHLIGLWAEKRCNKMAHALNQLNLWLEGFDQALNIGCEVPCGANAPCLKASNTHTNQQQTSSNMPPPMTATLSEPN
ncbi:MotA/TolQ/ExbB proton channel family protein [Shewanella intestini]|uniref:Flagellar motor protein MotA n=1 Tax=Shewanella intestini TaxID=2017544 RepID=A0ABS5I4S1_9GAMM|nr:MULTISPECIES: MotA/TolQ/ExbB proton channel family protein [Shewanella]MBR9728365.1 flagellar motor protein MotA [Shewanella intestini]MRG36707.1 flagellar motor protein MotA [Shewanella sp. XMDDZSB0408]